MDKKSYSKIDVLDKQNKEKLLKKMDELKYADVLKYLKNELEESVRVTEFNYKVEGFLEDVAYALHRSIDDLHGYTSQADRQSLSGTNPPEMIDVRFADGNRLKVPFGQIMLPQLGKDAYIDMNYNEDERKVYLTGRCEKQYVSLVDQIVERTILYVTYNSIYRFQAIKIEDPKKSPTFIDIGDIDSRPMFLTSAAKFATVPIEARITQTELCIQNDLDLKFGALLEGDYGTGKTLYAFKLANKAIKNQWTFIYCPYPEHTLEVLKIANHLNKNGKGVVLFIEDIDKVLDTREDFKNEISLLLDGGETKDSNIITIFTTNHIDRINPTFLRGKRIGSIITLTHLDSVTAKNMIESILVDQDGNSILSDNCQEAADLAEECKIVPAFLCEILDRVKAHRIYTGGKMISCEDIIDSINSYRVQMDIARVKAKEENPYIVAYTQFIKEVSSNITKMFDPSEGLEKALVQARKK